MGNENGRMLSPEEIKSREIAFMDNEIKRKLNTKSSKYCLKLVIKGERNTGKTSLFNRLQGKAFTEEYSPTPEIQIAHINWNYKNTDDIVDVEVWDVVDVATSSKKKSSQLLVTSNQQQQKNDTKNPVGDEEEDLDSFYADIVQQQQKQEKSGHGGSFKIHQLDANTINVMKGASAVIFMVNPNKKWTFQYVEKEILKVPQGIYILICTNFRDQGDWSKQLSQSEIDALCELRPETTKHVDASMLNAYGLRTIVSFFNIPFLSMQRIAIEKQLERNALEFESALSEVNMLNQQQTYNDHVKRLEQNRLEREQSKSQPPSPNLLNNQTNQTNPNNKLSNTPKTLSQSSPNLTTPQPQTQIPQPIQHQPPLPVQQPVQQPSQPQSTGGFFSRLGKSIGISRNDQVIPSPQQPSQPIQQQQQPPVQIQQHTTQPKSQVPTKISNIDEFNPNEDYVDNFYNDKPTTTSPKTFITNLVTKTQTKQPEPVSKNPFGDDDDDDDSNPFVTKDEDYEDDSPPPVIKYKSTPVKPATTITPKSTTSTPISKPQPIVKPTSPTQSPKSTPQPTPQPKSTPSQPTSSPKPQPITKFNDEDEDEDDQVNSLVSRTDIDSDDDQQQFSTPKSKPTKSNSATLQPTPSPKSNPQPTPSPKPTPTTTPVTSKTPTPISSKSNIPSTIPPKQTTTTKSTKPIIKFNEDEEEDEINSLVSRPDADDSDDDQDQQQFSTPKSSNNNAYSSIDKSDESIDTSKSSKAPSSDDYVPPQQDLDDWFDD